jgi:hypothetical protein
MVARILAECGVYLGEPDRLFPATPANPEGHFEHLDFLYVNKTVLRKLLASWRTPPRAPAWRALGWRLRAPRELARGLIEEMGLRPPWAWKDPRTSLTLPFWVPLLPDVRIVACVRDPLAVAQSLGARDGLPTQSGLKLWHAYYRALLRSAPPGRLVVTTYESYFDDPSHEIRRLLGRLGIAYSGPEVEAAAATVSDDLRRQRPTERTSLPPALARCHAELLAHA